MNTRWEALVEGRDTVRAHLFEVVSGKRSLGSFMKPYQPLVAEYVACLLIGDKAVTNAEACSMASRAIWAELIKNLPGKLASEWGREGVRFRDVLLEAVHEAHYSWGHPDRSEEVVMQRISPMEAWHRAWRSHVLRKARARLKRHQRENEPKNIYFTLFCVWDEDHRASHEAMIERLATIPDGREMTAVNFRKTLGRACERFGLYLAEVVKADFLGGDTIITSADYLRAFEELELMDYVERSEFFQDISRIYTHEQIMSFLCQLIID